MNFNEIYSKFAISFEIFPPKTDEGVKNLFAELDILTKYNPAFISVTYGAGGSTRNRTLDLALEIRRRYNIQPLVHFTCVGAGRAEIQEYLKKVKELGLTDILALRGDPPKGQTDFVPAADGFAHANELVKFISEESGFNIAVAGYPDKHPACSDINTDTDNLIRKINAGGQLVLTQLFFKNDNYFKLVETIRNKGSDITIIPGIMPMTNPSQIEKMAAMCGARVPTDLADALNNAKTPGEAEAAGIDFAVKQCLELKKFGVKGFHFYPLNKAHVVQQILERIV